MKISGITGKISIPEPSDNEKKERVSERKDRIEISAEAKELSKAKRMEKIEEVRQKIENGFYDLDEVLERVAEKILSFFKLEQ